MEFLKPIMKRFDRKTCFFYQNKKCILNHTNCIVCQSFIKKIEGMTDSKDYLNYVTTRSNSQKAFNLSIISLLCSLITLLIKLFEQ